MAKGYSAAGCENPAEAAHVAVKSGKVSLKKYWTPAEKEKGYSTRSVGKLTPALTTSEHSGGAKQNVKGVRGKKAPSESKPAAGRKQ